MTTPSKTDYRTGPLPAGVIGRTTLGLLRRSLHQALPVWAALAVVSAVTQAIALSSPERPAGAFPLTVPELAGGAASAVLLAAGLRILLGAQRIWSLDAGALAYFAFGLATGAVQLAWGWMAAQAVAQRENPQAFLQLGLPLVIAGSLMLWANFRLGLWPLAQLMGHPGLTLAGAWRRMAGAFWGWVLATLALVWIPYFLILSLFAGGLLSLRDTSPAALAANALLGLLLTPTLIVTAALMAAVYHLRAGEPPVD
jgi:TM2 domain-containing membrane protein YozV